MKISVSEYNKKIGKILDDPNLGIADKLIQAVIECGHYEIVDDKSPTREAIIDAIGEGDLSSLKPKKK